MANESDTADERQLTTDREMIRGWVGEHDATPVRYAGVEGESNELRIVPEGERDESHEELTWEEFFEEFERTDQVVVYHGDREDDEGREGREGRGGRGPFEVLSRDEAIGVAAVESEEVEEALLEGETVTSEVTETTVVERTVVEEATIESEVVDREVLEGEIVDAELLTREVVSCELTGVEPAEGVIEFDQFEAGHRTATAGEIEVEVDEAWSVTREVLERLTVESRVVDREVTETDTVETDTLRSEVDVEGVQRTILESDLLDSDAVAGEVVDSGSVRSEFGEGDLIKTWVLERKTVEEELSLRKRLAGEITEDETLESETIHREVIESEIVGDEEPEAGTATAEMAGAGTAEGGAAEDLRTTPTEDDEGKTVVDAAGEKIGMVVEVDGDTAYVDPHPSLTDRIKAALDWGEVDEEAYPVGPDRIARITDDRIELAVAESES